jgi:thymidine kinase
MPKGFLTLHVGPQFSSKTSHLIRTARRCGIAHTIALVIVPAVIAGNGSALLQSFGGECLKSSEYPSVRVICLQAHEQLPALDGIAVLIIDSLHFFDESLFVEILQARDRGIEIIAAGLQRDFREIPFPLVTRLLGATDKVVTHFAVCSICGSERASCTQRIYNGRIAGSDEPILIPGGSEIYQARCRSCYVKPS